MRFSTLCMATILTLGAVGVAHASPNLIQNGDFSSTTPPDPNNGNALQVGWGGQFVDGWTGSGYTIWYPSANNAVNGCGKTQYHSGSGGQCSTLNVVGTPVPGSGTFVALDGVAGGLRGSMQQTVNGLAVNGVYTLTFSWGTTQETQASAQVPSHDQYLGVTFGGSTQNTATVMGDWNTFGGWYTGSMTFTASSTSQLLDFISYGLPADGPPMILLTNVSLTRNVPEPADLAMFGGGLLGLGFLVLLARRREMRRRAADGTSAI